MKKQKTNKVKTVVYLIHFISIDIWARNGVLHIFLGGGETKIFNLENFQNDLSDIYQLRSNLIIRNFPKAARPSQISCRAEYL